MPSLRELRMDRVKRTLFLASSLLAIPAIGVPAKFALGQSPQVQLAVGQAGTPQTQVIRQVAGRQTSQQQTRPGLLQVLAGVSSKGSENHSHQNMAKTQSKGLFGTLFSGSSSDNRQSQPQPSHASHNRQQPHHQHQHGSQDMGMPARQAATPVSNTEPDWSGVPFHSAETGGTASTPVPLTDPGTAESPSEGSGTRIVRGGSSRTIEAIPAAARRPSESSNSGEGSAMMALPTPPGDVSVMAPESRTESFSASTSSRRSARRNVDALVPFTEPDAAADRLSTIKEDDSVADLVPKVSRKPAPQPASKQDVTKTSTGPSTSVDQADASRTPAKAEASSTLPASSKPTSRVGTPRTPSAVVPKRASAGTVTQSESVDAPSPSLDATPADDSSSQTNAMTASSKTTKPGTPAISASHRSGPPSQAFTPEPIDGVEAPQNEMPSGSATRANTASSPIGSGVVPNSGVASYRRPSASDHADTTDTSGTAADHHDVANDYRGRQMTTHGQPVPPSLDAAAPSHGYDVPVQSIDGHASTATNPTPAGDNFSRTTSDARNQMRGAWSQADDSESTATSELPGIRVTTHGPGAIMIRQNSQYEIRVENRGAIDASGVMVRALVPDWADLRGQNATRGDIDNQKQGSSERLVWTIDQLPAGASETLYVRLTAARSGTYDLDVDWTLIPQKSTAKVQVREPRLDLTIEGPDEVVFGQSQTYKVRVLNPGDGTAPNVVFTLSPNSATPQSQRIGDIPPGKEAQFDVELTAQDLGDLKIHGLASGELALRAESEKTIRVAAAKLEAVLSGPQVKYQNTEAMYSLQLQNNGTAASERITASLRLPTGVKYLGGIEEAIQEGSVLRWEVSALAPGASRDYQFRCNMGSTGEHLFAFDCRGSAAGSAAVSIATRVESIADLVLTVSDPAAPAPIGTDVTYEIVIRNRGSKEATDVRAIAQFSHGIEPQRIEGQSGEVMTGQVLFDAIPRIGAGQEVRIKVIAQADRPGHHRFRTEIRSGDTVLVAEEATHYMSPKGERVSRRSSETLSR